jgi:hypothetical protein
MNIEDRSQFNRFINLDSIEDRIINYLVDSDSIYANRIWKVLKYSEVDALLRPNLTKKEKIELIDNGSSDQSEKRVFRYPYLEDAFVVKSSILRIYIDSVVPENHLVSKVNIGFDLISNNKINNLYNDENDELEYPETYRPISETIRIKSRNSVLLKNLLSELNGKEIAGVGVLQFNQDLSPFSQARLGFFNNQNYSGYKVLMCCMHSGVN